MFGLDPVAVSGIAGVVVAVIGMVLGKLALSARRKVKDLSDQGQKSFGFHGTLAAVTDLIDDVIESTYTLSMDLLTEKFKDGKLTSDEISEITVKIKAHVMELINERAKGDLTFVADDVEKFIQLKVQVAITRWLKK